MPTVPQATPTVQSRPIDPGYQSAAAASLDAFGASQGAALAQTGARIQGVADEAGRLALKAMIEDNEREAKKLDVELSSTLRAINYGDGTAQNPGYFGLKGEAALSGYANAQKAVQEAQKKLTESAKNDRVKQMFGEVAARRVESELNTMARFVGQERVRAADTVSEARLSEAANDAAKSWNDPKVIGRSIGLAVNEIKDMAQRNGWGPEVEAAKVREATSVIATGAAKAALAVEATGAAQRIFKQYESSFSPEARASISRQIREGSIQHSAQALRDQAIAAHPGDLAKQAEFIRQRASGKIEDAAMASISNWHSIQRASEADVERAKTKALRGEAQSRFDMILEQTSDPKERIRLARSLPPEIRDDVEARLNSEVSRSRTDAADRRQEKNDELRGKALEAFDRIKAANLSDAEEVSEARKLPTDIREEVEAKLRRDRAFEREGKSDARAARQDELRGEAQKVADAIMLANPLDQDARIAAARSIENPELRDAVEERIRREDAYRRQETADKESVARRAEHLARVEEQRRALAEKEQNKLAYKTADDLVSQGGSLNDLSPEVRSLLTPEQRLAIERYEDRRSNGMTFAKSSNQDKLNEYLNMAPEDLAAVTQAEMKTYLAKEDYTFVEGERRAAIQGKRDPKSPYSLQSRVAKKTVDLLGPADTEAEKKRHARIHNMVEEEIAREKRDTKKSVIPRAREQEIINDVFDKVTMPGKLWGTNDIPAFDAVKEVPEKDRKLIVSSFKARLGVAPTELQILRAYRDRLEAEAAKAKK